LLPQCCREPHLPTLETAHILHVDDDRDSLDTTKLLLDRPGVEVVSAASGAVALERLREHDFALALVDVNMPEVSGFQLAESMRDDDRTREIPIIFLTGASGDAARTFRGYEAGAVDFLIKPVHPRVLVSKVDVFVALYLQRKSMQDQKDDCERLLLTGALNSIGLSRTSPEAGSCSSTPSFSRQCANQ
jgi:DNA-binding response OmpR family regulator